MALSLGTTLRGGKYNFRLIEKLGDKTVSNPVFKAEVLPGAQSIPPNDSWAVVKTANVNDQIQKDCLVKEYNYYKTPFIASSKSFRKMYDTINDQTNWTDQKPFCLAFEWMDVTLAEVPCEEHMQNPILVAKILKTCLEAFAKLKEENLVYSDLKPGNVLISNINKTSLEVKLGDLGLMGPEGTNQRWLQPEAFRSPEGWTGVRCFHKSDVWSIAAMLLQRYDHNLLGDFDNIDRGRIHPMAWCLAKIMLLFDPYCTSILPPPADVDERLRDYFKLAKDLTITIKPESSTELLLQIPSFEDWVELAIDHGIPKVVLDVIRILAVPNPTERPLALQVLKSREYKVLQDTVGQYEN